MSFTIFDIIILTILTISSLHGFYKGIVRIILSSVSFFASIIIATLIYPFISELLAKHLQNEGLIAAVSGIIAYALSSIIFGFIMSRLASTLYQITSNFFDKVLGLIGGAIQGGLIALVIFLVVACFYSGSYKKAANLDELVVASLNRSKYPSWLTNSTTYEYLYEAGTRLKENLPKHYFESIKLHLKKANLNINSDNYSNEPDSLYPEDF